jgi:hypothetical protein
MRTSVFGRYFRDAQRSESPRSAGPVRSGDPERDWYYEQRAATPSAPYSDDRQLRRMSWRAEGAQDYPGGALETLIEASHRGKGPRNYRRSDEMLREVVCEQLTEDPFIDAVDVSVDVHEGEVTLTGTVPSRSQKMRAEDLVADTHGVTEIHNMLTVRSDEIEMRMSGL